MIRIIDMECSVPRTDGPSREAGSATEPAGYGMANYSRIFRSRREGNERPAMDIEPFVDRLGKLGIVRSVPFGVSNEESTSFLRKSRSLPGVGAHQHQDVQGAHVSRVPRNRRW